MNSNKLQEVLDANAHLSADAEIERTFAETHGADLLALFKKGSPGTCWNDHLFRYKFICEAEGRKFSDRTELSLIPGEPVYQSLPRDPEMAEIDEAMDKGLNPSAAILRWRDRAIAARRVSQGNGGKLKI